MILGADKGFDIQEATGMSFRNIKVLSDETRLVIDIVHSDNLIFDRILYKDGAQLLFRVSGDRSHDINI